MMSLSLDEPRPIDSRGRASPPGEASSGESYPVSYIRRYRKISPLLRQRHRSARPGKNQPTPLPKQGNITAHSVVSVLTLDFFDETRVNCE